MASVTPTDAAPSRPTHLPEVLVGADLRGIDLRGADLRGLVFDRADLRKAHLNGADLTGASLRGVRLDDAELIGACLDGADLSGARAARLVVGRASMREATLFDADFSEASLSDADLSGADLRAATLDGARLLNAQLVGADLTQAALAGADLGGSDVTDATFRGAILRGADFRAIRGFDRADWIDVSVADTDTKVPGGPMRLRMPPPPDELRERRVVRGAVLLAAERVPVVVRRGRPDAGDERPVGPGHHEQGPVVGKARREQEQRAERPHPGHPVLDVPGLEVRVPGEARTPEGRLVVHPA